MCYVVAKNTYSKQEAYMDGIYSHVAYSIHGDVMVLPL
jgi:hypothetical protein